MGNRRAVESEVTDPIPEPELTTRRPLWGSRWDRGSGSRSAPGSVRCEDAARRGGPCLGKAGGSPSGRGPGSAGAALSGPPRLRSRGQRGGNGGWGGAAGCPEAAGSGAAPGPPQQFPQWAPGIRSGDVWTSGKHCGTPAGPPRPALQCAEPRPSRPTASRERIRAERCGAVRRGLRCVRLRPRGRRAWSHQELPRVFLPVPSGRGAGAGAAGRSPGTPARYRFCFRGRRRFRSNGGRVPPAPGIPHLPPPDKSRWIRRWPH